MKFNITPVLSFFGVDLAHQVEDLTSEVEALARQVEVRIARCDLLEQRLARVLGEKAALAASLSTLSQRHSAVVLSRGLLEKQLFEANRVKDLVTDRLQESITERKAREEVVLRDLTALHESLTATETEIGRLEGENARLREERAALAIDLERRIDGQAQAQSSFAGGRAEGDEDEEQPDDQVVYDRVTTHVFTLVRLSFREKNKWFLSQGKGALEINALITDEEWLNRVAVREVFFANGDLMKVRLRTVTRRRGSEEPRTNYTVEKVLGIIQPPVETALFPAKEEVPAES
jgi:hypothetical protein